MRDFRVTRCAFLHLFYLATLVVIVSPPAPALCELHVGFIGGFSGPGKAFGDAARNGFELAREELGSRNIRVTYEDDQFDPKKTVSAFNKLVHHNKVDVVIVLGSTPSAAIAALAEKHGIPTISWASAEHIAKGRQWVIRSWASGSDEGGALALKARELGLGQVGTLAYSDEYAAGVIRGFEAGFGSGSRSLGEVSANENEFSPFILQAKSKRLEGILLCLSVGQGARFARQMKQLRFKAMLLGCETFNSSTEVGLSQGALTGAWFATVPVSETFRARYQARFESDTSVGGSAVHYELYRLLADVAASSPSRDRVRQYLLSIKERNSVVGVFSIAARDHDQSFELPIVVKQIP